MTQRAKTGITGLDEMLRGGFLIGSAVLVEGAPGTGKTTLGTQFLYNGATLFDEPGLLISFEEFPTLCIATRNPTVGTCTNSRRRANCG
jgi:circadian clock protein KaiC